MKHNLEFELAWLGLKEGVHVYKYELDDRFMQERGAPEEYHGWHAQVTLTFDKKVNFFLLHFDVGGSVVAPCDRCGDDFPLTLWDEFDLVVKLTDEEEEANDGNDEADIVFIPRHETVIDISEWLYEFTMLSVPLQKVHPDRPDGTPGCNPEALKLLNQLSQFEETDGEPEEQPNIWKGLEALKEQPSEKKKTN